MTLASLEGRGCSSVVGLTTTGSGIVLACCLGQLRVRDRAGVPVDWAFFAELAAYLRSKRPGCATPEWFVVLGGRRRAGPGPRGLRKVFRVHRARSGALRMR